ncbi:MAG: aminopeptidase P family protein [Labilithrix sp.]|nr:aminopeptidase P family protein [Labilithrix sp.]MCW5812258.1 aminopeptidase P family protein [Labilithrix sp.]
MRTFDVIRRRQLLGGLAGAALGACAPRSTGPSRAPSRVRTIPETTFRVRTEYPSLPPLPDEVYAARRAAARERARSAGADVILATSGSANFGYLAGADFGRSERLIALVLSVVGDAVLLAPSFELARVQKRVRATPPASLILRGWEESEDPIAKVRDAIGERRAILLEPHTDYAVAAAVHRALGSQATLIDGSGVFEELRVVKSDEEIARMQRAVDITEDAFAATFARLVVGMREQDVARIVEEEHRLRGVRGGALVQFGPSAAFPHGAPTSAPLASATPVLIDGGCSFQDWQSDVTRTRWFGDEPPSPRFVTLYNLVHDAQSAAIAAVAPGVPAQAIDRAARAVIARAGFGPQFTHRLGHGIGMDGHEPVYMVEGNPRPLEPGLVFSVEPGIYIPNELGVRLEEQVACTSTGARVLSQRPPRL